MSTETPIKGHGPDVLITQPSPDMWRVKVDLPKGLRLFTAEMEPREVTVWVCRAELLEKDNGEEVAS